jgi:hypothetical protein
VVLCCRLYDAQPKSLPLSEKAAKALAADRSFDGQEGEGKSLHLIDQAEEQIV